MAFGYTDGYLYSRSYLPDDQSWTSWKYCVFGGTWNNVGMFGWSDAMQYPAIKTKANKSGLEDAVSPFFGYKNNSYTWIFVEYKNEITSLSAVAQQIKGTKYQLAGPQFFTYNGRLVSDIYNETQGK